MKNLIFVPVILACLAAPAFAEAVPCETALADLRAAITAGKPSDADMAKITELQDKGIERCNADDDQRADDFFAEAMKLLGK